MIVAYIKIVFQGNFSRDVGAPWEISPKRESPVLGRESNSGLLEYETRISVNIGSTFIRWIVRR
jgi:hypothetical protein